MYSDGKISAPISASDPYYVMGVGQYNGGYDVGYICSDQHGKTNIYSYVKPIEENSVSEIEFTNQKYIDSLVPVKYTSGGAAPTDFTYGYNKPSSFFRLTDFDGYDHNEYPVRGSIADIPDTVEFETDPISYEFYYDSSDRGLLTMLLSSNPTGNEVWKSKIICVINVNGKNRAFMLNSYYFSSNRVSLYFLASKELYDLLRSAGSETFNVSAFVVGVPQSHPHFGYDTVQEVPSGYDYVCYPASPVCTPNKNFVLKKPKRRMFYDYRIYDNGDDREYYVPDGTTVNGFIRYNDDPIIQIQNEQYIDEIQGSGSKENEGTNYVEAQIQIPDVQFSPNPTWVKPEISHNADRAEYEEGLHTTTLYWDKKVAGEEFSAQVAFTYADPNYRPEE